MAACIQIPFRRTQNVNLSQATQNYISSKFNHHPAQFKQDCDSINRLRDDAVHVTEPHVTGIPKLTQYVAQLRYMVAKFPLELDAEFPWWASVGYHKDTPIVSGSLKFELANIIFNLAVLYSQLAYHGNRTSPEGLKTSAQQFQASAGTLAFLRTEVLPDVQDNVPDDMDEATLLALENLMLAQAQECFWQKAVKDNMKDGTIARLAVCVSDYYDTAGSHAINSNAIVTEWIHHCTAKHHHFAAAAQYRQSLDCMEKRKYGEEVARLRDSVTCINEGLKEKRYIDRVVTGDMEGLKSRVQEELKRTQKDNDLIYHIPEPTKPELKLLDRANMVKANPPKDIANGLDLLGRNLPFGVPLFEKLVPYAVHQAKQSYNQKRDMFIERDLIGELEAMNKKMADLLASLNLPASLQTLEKPLGVPPGLATKAEELRQNNAPTQLKRIMEDTSKLKNNDFAIYQEGLTLLHDEAQEDDKLRSKYGTNSWTRPTGQVALASLYKQSQDLQGYLNSASGSDNLVQIKIRENEHILNVLSGTPRDLERYIPSSRNGGSSTLPAALEKSVSKLRGVLNDSSRAESRRNRKIDAIHRKAQSDDVLPDILEETTRLEREYPSTPIAASQFEDISRKRIEDLYAPDLDAVKVEQSDHDQLCARLREANAEFVQVRRGHDCSLSKERESVLQELETGYNKYKEIIGNLETGRKFYADLAGHVTRFRDSVRKQVTERRQQADELVAQLDFDRMRLQDRTELRNQKLQNQPQQANISSPVTSVATGANAVKRATRSSAIRHQIEPESDPLPAPVPVAAAQAGRITPAVVSANSISPAPIAAAPPSINAGPRNAAWQPGMGIKFG